MLMPVGNVILLIGATPASVTHEIQSNKIKNKQDTLHIRLYRVHVCSRAEAFRGCGGGGLSLIESVTAAKLT